MTNPILATVLASNVDAIKALIKELSEINKEQEKIADALSKNPNSSAAKPENSLKLVQRTYTAKNTFKKIYQNSLKELVESYGLANTEVMGKARGIDRAYAMILNKDFNKLSDLVTLVGIHRELIAAL